MFRLTSCKAPQNGPLEHCAHEVRPTVTKAGQDMDNSSLLVTSASGRAGAAKMLSALLQSGLVYAVFFAGLALALKAVLEV